VFGPHRFGLAQLHQLRGRVGRGARDARFVLVGDPDKVDSKAFAKRVRALEQLDARGDGLRLALADSLLRGTGRLDDADEQSGHASALGLEIYEFLLGRAADDPDASMAELLRGVPRVVGAADGLFEGEVDLDDVMVAVRAALDTPEAVLRDGNAGVYARLVAACAVLGAWKVGVTDESLVFALSNGGTADGGTADGKTLEMAGSVSEGLAGVVARLPD
ncbi:MAG: hypothetical protein WBA35_11925, partial [Litorimonas sp.]